jgi:hypothetical protein
MQQKKLQFFISSEKMAIKIVKNRMVFLSLMIYVKIKNYFSFVLFLNTVFFNAIYLVFRNFPLFYLSFGNFSCFFFRKIRFEILRFLGEFSLHPTFHNKLRQFIWIEKRTKHFLLMTKYNNSI